MPACAGVMPVCVTLQHERSCSGSADRQISFGTPAKLAARRRQGSKQDADQCICALARAGAAAKPCCTVSCHGKFSCHSSSTASRMTHVLCGEDFEARRGLFIRYDSGCRLAISHC